MLTVTRYTKATDTTETLYITDADRAPSLTAVSALASRHDAGWYLGTASAGNGYASHAFIAPGRETFITYRTA